MSPIISLQRRLREAGRIRLGEKVATKNGKTAPSKLSEFRFTSSDEKSIREIARLYGGEVQPWDGAPVGEQWEVFTESKALNVIVPPVDLAFSQWFERWSGGGCTYRCDGVTNVLTDKPCVCDPEVPECKPTTRLGVILTELEGIGIWRLEIHGWNGAQELLGAVDVLRTMQSRGSMVPARLLLEQRQSKRGGKTFNFAVPVLDLNLNVAQVLSGEDRPHITPVQQLATPLSLAEQLAAVDNPDPAPKRKNAAQTLPATGLDPRPAELSEFTADSETEVFIDVSASPAPVMRRLQAMMNGSDLAPKDEISRIVWVNQIIETPVDSLDSLTEEQANSIMAAIRSGQTTTYQPGEEPF